MCTRCTVKLGVNSLARFTLIDPSSFPSALPFDIVTTMSNWCVWLLRNPRCFLMFLAVIGLFVRKDNALAIRSTCPP